MGKIICKLFESVLNLFQEVLRNIVRVSQRNKFYLLLYCLIIQVPLQLELLLNFKDALTEVLSKPLGVSPPPRGSL